MKTYFILNILIFSFYACSMGSKVTRPERRAHKKIWRPCKDIYKVNKKENLTIESPKGKLCNRVCLKRSKDNCKEWKTNIKDFAGKDFEFFRSAGFIMIDEDYVL